MNLKEFLSDPTLQKDENGNILCRKIKNSKLHHMKPQFCMSPRLHSEGWEIVRRLLPPPFEFTTEPKGEYKSPVLLVDNNTEMATPLNKFTTSSEKEKPFEIPKNNITDFNVQLPEYENVSEKNKPVKVKPKRKKKRKTTTKRKRTVKTLTPETNNG